MKKLLFSIMFALMAICANAQNVLKAENVTVAAGEQGIAWIALENAAAFCGFQLEVTLPEGLGFNLDEDEETYGKLSTVMAPKHQLESSLKKGNVRVCKFVAYHSKNQNFKSSEDGSLLGVYIKVGENTEAGDYTVTVANANFSQCVEGQTATVGHDIEGVTFTVTVPEPINQDEVFDAIKNQIANVQEAIDNFDAEVAKLNYASRYEGEEITGPVDAAREWVAATTEAYEAKYDAKELTAEDGVMGEMMEQTMAVHEALNAAAKYDAMRHYTAAYNYWNGSEADEIEGQKAGVEAIVETLPVPGQSAINSQIVMLESAIDELKETIDNYVSYSEDDQAAIIAQYEAIVANVNDIVAAADEAKADKEAEDARQEANMAAAIADMEKLEDYQAEITKVIKDKEEFISADTNQTLVTLLGSGTYETLIQQALDEVAEEGVYESPINDEWWAQQIADLKKEIADNIQADEDARVAANEKAYEDDLAALKAVSRSYDQMQIDLKKYAEYADEKANLDAKYAIEDAKDAAEKAYKAVATAGLYESPFDAEELQAAVNKVINDARNEANMVAAEADMAKLEGLQAQISEIIKGNDKFLSPDDIDVVTDICGDTWPMVIQGAVEGAAGEVDYESPVNWEQLAANIAEVEANIAAAKQAEAARQEANMAAAQADVEKLEGYQAEITAAIAGNEEFITADTNQQIETLLGDTYMILINQALEEVAEEGEYASPINGEWWAQQVADIKGEIADGKQWPIDHQVAEGDYYIYNVEAGRFLNGANAWGTKASVTEAGQLMTLVGVKGGYNIDSHISNGGANHFLGDNNYVDSPAATMAIVPAEDGTCTIKCGDKFLAYQEVDGQQQANFVDEETAAAKWKLVTRADIIASMADATEENPVDVTSLIADPNFSRNNQYSSLWVAGEGSPALGKGGPNENLNAERWGGNSQTFSYAQTLTGLPNGTYKLTAQGYYRYNNTPDNTNAVAEAAHADGSEVIYSYLFANGEKLGLKSIADEASVELFDGKMPFSQNDAAEAFALGAYQNEIIVEVTDGTLTIGIAKDEHIGCDWTVWDNFQLQYISAPDTWQINPYVEAEIAATELDGQVLVATDEAGEFVFRNTEQDLHKQAIAEISDIESLYYRFKFHKVEVDGVEGNLYTIQLCNEEKNNLVIWGGYGQGWINFQPGEGSIIFAIGLNDAQYGQDFQYGGLWDVQYEKGKGYLIENVGRRGTYLSPVSDNPCTEKTYVRLFDALSFGTPVEPEKPVTDAELASTSILVNGNAAGEYGDTPCAVGKENGGNPHAADIEVVDHTHVFAVHATAKVDQPWDNQFWIAAPVKFYAGDKVKVSFRYKASKEASVGTQAHSAASDYNHWACIGNVNFTTEWKEFSAEIDVTTDYQGSKVQGSKEYIDAKGFQSIAFNLSDFAEANDYYFDDIVWEVLSDEGTKKYEEAVSINAIAAEAAREGIYDLQGRKVEKMEKGHIYIINGKKVVK